MPSPILTHPIDARTPQPIPRLRQVALEQPRQQGRQAVRDDEDGHASAGALVRRDGRERVQEGQPGELGADHGGVDEEVGGVLRLFLVVGLVLVKVIMMGAR